MPENNIEEKTPLEKAIEKVRKLQKLAGNNPNQNEILAALAAADRIIREYQLSQAQLEELDSARAEGFVKKRVTCNSKRVNWIEVIIRSVCNHYGTTWYMDTSNVPVPEVMQEFTGGKAVVSAVQYVVAGKKSDVEISDYTISFLVKYCKVIAEIQSKGNGVAYRNSFLEGFGEGCRQKFAAMKEEERRVVIQSSAMVLLNNRAIEAKNWLCTEMHLRMATALSLSGRCSNNDGRSAGIVAGRNANLKKGLNQ